MYLITGWPSLGATCVSPAVFLAFGAGETPAPERSEGEWGGGRNPPPQRPQKTRDDSIRSDKGRPPRDQILIKSSVKSEVLRAISSQKWLFLDLLALLRISVQSVLPNRDTNPLYSLLTRRLALKDG
ncbi:hypothetical protein ES703_101357 [subsurface metagenome]